MVTQELLSYIKSQLDSGIQPKSVVQALKMSGWQNPDIQWAFINLQQPLSPDILSGQANSSVPSINPTWVTAGEFAGPVKLVQESWRVFSQNLGLLMGVFTLPIMVMAVLSYLPEWLVINSAPGFGVFAVFSTMGVVLVSAVSILNAVIQVWSQVALVVILRERARSLSVLDVYRLAWSRVGAYIWVMIIFSLVLIGGYMFFIVPGVLFSIWFGFAGFIVVTEETGGMDALLKSREYIRGYVWRTISRTAFLVLLLFGIVLAIVLVFVISGFVIAKMPVNIELFGDSFELLIVIAQFIVAIIPLALAYIYNYLIYENLVQLKSGHVDDYKSKSKVRYIFAALLGLIGMLAIPVVFILAAFDPASQIKTAVDAQLKNEVDSTQHVLGFYYTENQRYPNSLEELGDLVFGYDEESLSKMEYKVLEEGQDYEICVEFAVDGRQCVKSYESFVQTEVSDGSELSQHSLVSSFLLAASEGDISKCYEKISTEFATEVTLEDLELAIVTMPAQYTGITGVVQTGFEYQMDSDELFNSSSYETVYQYYGLISYDDGSRGEVYAELVEEDGIWKINYVEVNIDIERMRQFGDVGGASALGIQDIQESL